MTKTHYDPYFYKGTSGPEGDGEYYDPGDFHTCGTRVTANEDTQLTKDWNHVTCKRCLKQKQLIMKRFEECEKAIENEMGRMAELFKESGI